MSGERGHVYEHGRFPAGLWVYVLPELRGIHPLSPVAGKYGETTTGIVYEALEAFEDQRALVPVLVEGSVWYVEEAYVMLVSGSEGD